MEIIIAFFLFIGGFTLGATTYYVAIPVTGIRAFPVPVL